MNKFYTFTGVVEDRHDPEKLGRVRVRCFGLHSESKTDIPTEDLPWARVGLPTTMAQGARIGGTHGMQPGNWVFGFFLDGEEVTSTPVRIFGFVFTAKRKVQIFI